MREFEDHEGRTWIATVDRRGGEDFKGRYSFVARPAKADPEDTGARVFLDDVRWNSEKTARRTLETMSGVELRRRLRSAQGRASTGSVTR